MSYLMKVVIVGDSNSGKEQIVERYIEKGSQDNNEITIGCKNAIIHLTINELSLKVHLLELNAEERFINARKAYHFGALGGILVYDVLNRESLDRMEDWSEEIWENSGKGVIQLVIFGINAENRDRSVNSVTKEEGKKMASKISKKAKKEGYEVPYYEISTKVKKDIETGLEYLAKSYILEIENLNRNRSKLRNWFRLFRKRIHFIL